MKTLIKGVLLFVPNFILALYGITFLTWEWWAITLGYCIYAAINN